MRPRDRQLFKKLDDQLVSFDKQIRRLPGITDTIARHVFVEQIVESLRRVKYISVIQQRDISGGRADPGNELFDPVRAAILHQRNGSIDEAFWLVFLFVHFGRHKRAGWRYVREIYGGYGKSNYWNWKKTSADPAAFREWLHENEKKLKRSGVPRGFGNHRKYQSLDAFSETGTGAAVESYIQWVGPLHSHATLIEESNKENRDRRKTFDALYKSMCSVVSFGRTAKFDYLCMLEKLGLAPIEPGSVYLKGATGPLRGAQLLFAGSPSSRANISDLETYAMALEEELRTGMQALEDALCNWQKSPTKFVAFRG